MCERNIHQLPLVCYPPGKGPASQVGVLTGNWISNPSLYRMMLQPTEPHWSELNRYWLNPEQILGIILTQQRAALKKSRSCDKYLKKANECPNREQLGWVARAWLPSHRVAGFRPFEWLAFKLKPERWGELSMRRKMGGEGSSIVGRAKSTCQGPEVGKTFICWRNQSNATSFQMWSLWHRG